MLAVCGGANHIQDLISLIAIASPATFDALPLQCFQLRLQASQLALQPFAFDLNIIRALRYPELLRIKRKNLTRVFSGIVPVLFVLVLGVKVVEAARK